MYIHIQPNPHYDTQKTKLPVKKLRKRWHFTCCDRVLDFVKSYCSYSGIHGFFYMVKTGLTLFEKLFWWTLIIISLYFCVEIGLQSVDRYYTKSTVVGLERDYYFWNTTLPSLTICPLQRLSQKLIDEYCDFHNIEGQRKEDFSTFMESLANSTYINFDNIAEFDTIDQTLDELNIKPELYMELIFNLTFDYTYEPNELQRIRNVFDKAFIHVRQVLTEYGLCYLTNNLIGPEYTSRYLIFGQHPEINRYELQRPVLEALVGTFFFKEVGYDFKGFSNDAIDLFIHSAYEIMTVDNNFGYTEEGVKYVPQSMEITTDQNFERAVTVAQRKCRFNHESNLTHFPVYTKNICLQECRLNLALKICKCIPHFYPNRIANPKPVCNYKTLKKCFPPHKNDFLKLYRKGRATVAEGFTCYCQQNCRDAVLSIESANVMKSSNVLMRGIGGSISMKKWPRQRLKRQVIYSFTDLLVSIGGTAGLFLGFSVLGAVEFVYFFTLRLICHIRGYKI